MLWQATYCGVAAMALAIDAKPSRADDIGLGEYLSGECVACHRLDGKDKGIPSIVGLAKGDFLAALRAYKLKERPNQIMQTISSRLTDQEMSALAAYFGQLQSK